MLKTQRQPPDAELREMARYFYALKDILRLRILVTLGDREMTVTELAQELRISQPLVSFHLRPLRVLGLVQVRRVGREVFYSVNVAEIQRRQDEFMNLLTRAKI
ncbi:MAG: metalloregulator ArsR/SmtB family transcription factor [Anaerolineae bacterium]|nr:metalloregulator ArsR/SmtB family transcription factor [Anaerolineae bacterium]